MTPRSYSYSYDGGGTLIGSIHYSSRGVQTGRTTYEFKQNKLVSRGEFDEKNVLQSCQTWNYDTNGRISVYSALFNWVDMVYQTVEMYEYDARGAVIGKFVYCGGVFDRHEKRQYKTDANGTTITITGNDGKGTPALTLTLQYNTKDQLVKKTLKYRDNDECSSFSDIYEYGRDGNPVKLTVKDYAGKSVSIYRFEWEKAKVPMNRNLFEEIISKLMRVGC